VGARQCRLARNTADRDDVQRHNLPYRLGSVGVGDKHEGRSYLLKREIGALAKVLPADDVITGAESLIRAYGFGPIVPNTILLGETGREDTYARFARLIQLVHRMGRNLILVREGNDVSEEIREQVDIWWRGEKQNIGLMLALALLLKRNGIWSRARITVKTVAGSADEAIEAEQRLTALVEPHRVRVETEVIRSEPGRVFQTIRESSADADLVLIGIRPPADDIDTDPEYLDYYLHLLESTEGLPATAMVLASEGTDYLKILGPA